MKIRGQILPAILNIQIFIYVILHEFYYIPVCAFNI